ncbi:hypothetical protein NUH86_10945 [Sphingobium sp. JS3065]|uniref:hypothetical protein n=1 Tax=Sphingobium sp. JS3065 TaxID=2970925 RepID=UPI002264C222|nr:hypothetical protein [Sphingobium sp. JS3065]UZW54051.1 hypothetical protein NUH86_10945 [Sphingobium sp. JS3065]
MQLVAAKAFTYATRRLKAGDYFTTRNSADGRALVATGRARLALDDAAVPQDQRASNIDTLRAEYVEVLGKRPYHGWSEEELSAKIAEARAEA